MTRTFAIGLAVLLSASQAQAAEPQGATGSNDTEVVESLPSSFYELFGLSMPEATSGATAGEIPRRCTSGGADAASSQSRSGMVTARRPSDTSVATSHRLTSESASGASGLTFASTRFCAVESPRSPVTHHHQTWVSRRTLTDGARCSLPRRRPATPGR